MKQVILFLVLVLACSISFADTLSSQEVKECVEKSYKVERLQREDQDRIDELNIMSRQLDSMDSKLTGLEWDYGSAERSLRNCRIVYNRDCYYEMNQVDSIANRFNSLLSQYEQLRREYNRKVEIRNRKNDYLNDYVDEADHQCFRKGLKYQMDDLRKYCDGEDTAFCNKLGYRE